MTILLILFLSTLFAVIFTTIHLMILNFFNLKKISYIFIPFIISNLIIFYFIKDSELYKLFYNSFIINLSILIIYIEFLFLIKIGFTLSIITSFKKKNRFLHKELIKNYSNNRGAKWILINRLNKIKKLKIITFDKKINLTQLGRLLSIILIFLRTVLSVKDFG